MEKLTRRQVFERIGKGIAVAGATAVGLHEMLKTAEAAGIPWSNGMYQTFPEQYVCIDNVEHEVLQRVDIGALGPDVDTIFGLDFPGDIQTGALEVYRPSGQVSETRVVGVRRADLDYVQFNGVRRGDRFDIYKVSEYGGDETLRQLLRAHAEQSAHTHQKVVLIGDLGLFETQYGVGESGFLKTIIRAQRPARAGIPESNFVNPRTY